MMQILRLLGKLWLIGISAFVIHFLILKFLVSDAIVESFRWSIQQLYLIFLIISSIIVIITERISKKNFDQTGMSFLVLTSVQLVLVYLVFKPILNDDSVTSTEKFHAGFVFVLFLAIETLLIIQLLNKKQ
jgi:hypothetical protein